PEAGREPDHRLVGQPPHLEVADVLALDLDDGLLFFLFGRLLLFFLFALAANLGEVFLVGAEAVKIVGGRGRGGGVVPGGGFLGVGLFLPGGVFLGGRAELRLALGADRQLPRRHLDAFATFRTFRHRWVRLRRESYRRGLVEDMDIAVC